MKSRIVGILVGVFTILSPGWAQAGTQISCTFKQNPLFGVLVQTEEGVPVRGFWDQAYPAKVIFAGPRLWSESSVALEVKYINTRADVGVSYLIKLDHDEGIRLQYIWWPQQKSFAGAYSTQGKSHALVCNQRVLQ